MKGIKRMIDSWQKKNILNFYDYLACDIPLKIFQSFFFLFFTPLGLNYLFLYTFDSYFINLISGGLKSHILNVIFMVLIFIPFSVMANLIWWQRLISIKTPIEFRTLREKIKKAPKFTKWYDIVLLCTGSFLFLELFFFLYDTPLGFFKEQITAFSSFGVSAAMIFSHRRRNRIKH